MAIENSGSPIIGRIVSRSINMPAAAVIATATASATNQCSHVGPGRKRPGISQSMKTIDRNHVPIRARAPWEKLSVCVDL